ncbi:MAG: biopolymer transporter ExbD [Pirellulales bacterium]
MKIPAQVGRSGLHFNMTPMIDVVFLLIIFFLVSSHLAKQEVQANVELPAAASGNEPTELEQARVTVNVVFRDGAYSLLFGAEPVTAEDLQRRIVASRERLGDKLEVRIRADRRVPYSFVEPVMVAAARAGVWNITFAVVESQ